MLKFLTFKAKSVTPHVGVWIETLRTRCCRVAITVTPHVGVWIETEEIRN